MPTSNVMSRSANPAFTAAPARPGATRTRASRSSLFMEEGAEGADVALENKTGARANFVVYGNNGSLLGRFDVRDPMRFATAGGPVFPFLVSVFSHETQFRRPEAT